MQLVAMRQLSTPTRRVVVDTPFPSFDAALYGEELVVDCGRRSGSRIVLQTALAAMAGLLRRVGFGKADSFLLTDELRQLGSRDGIVVDLSGDMLTEDYGFLVGLSHFVPLVQAQLLGTPVVVCAQSVGPFHRLRPLARRVLSRSPLVTLRDSRSLDHLRGLGLDPTVTADVAFLLDADPVAADSVLRAHGLGDRDFFAVSVSPILERRFEDSHPGQRFADAIAHALSPVVAAGLPIVFVPHVTGPGSDKDDRVTAARCAPALAGECIQLAEELHPATTKGVIGRAQGILGCRMHANIAALSQGVPVAALSYSHKTPGIMAGLDQGDMVIDGAELTGDVGARVVAELLANRGGRAEQIAAALPAIKSLAAQNFVLIEDFLGSIEQSP